MPNPKIPKLPELGTVDKLFDYLNKSKWFIALIILSNTLTSKYISIDISKGADVILSGWYRHMAVFGLAFIVSRDIKISLAFMIGFYLIFKLFLNEKSSMCILPKSIILDINQDGVISENEIEAAQKTLDKLKKKMTEQNKIENKLKNTLKK